MGRRGGDAETYREAQRAMESHGVAERHGDTEWCREVAEWASHIHGWWIKIRRDTSGARDPSPRTDYPAQSSSTRTISPYNFWL